MSFAARLLVFSDCSCDVLCSLFFLCLFPLLNLMRAQEPRVIKFVALCTESLRAVSDRDERGLAIVTSAHPAVRAYCIRLAMCAREIP